MLCGNSGYFVRVSESELQFICGICQECRLCRQLPGRPFDEALPFHKFEIHVVDMDPNPVNRSKRIVDLTKPARYHCG
uniref:Uncharacterized protein n=1 Tax=Macrostomum lignano TaxID=282301 RepID=A0A1I8GL94_9PLAT